MRQANSSAGCWGAYPAEARLGFWEQEALGFSRCCQSGQRQAVSWACGNGDVVNAAAALLRMLCRHVFFMVPDLLLPGAGVRRAVIAMA